jgi:lipopolysaccharide export LptBFGC system permease protein LptF
VLVRNLRYVVKKDFFVFAFLILAILGALPYTLPVTAVASTLVVLSLTARNLRRRKARAR